MKRLLLLVMTACVWSAAIPAQAQFALSARALGMGGAYTAVSGDVYSPYWNPAGIARIRNFRVGLANGQVREEGVLDIIDLINNFPGDSVEEALNLIQRAAEKAAGGITQAQISAASGLAWNGFGFLFMPVAAGSITPRNAAGGIGINLVPSAIAGVNVPEAGSSLTFDGSSGNSYLLAYAHPIGTVDVGLNLKFTNYAERLISVTYNGIQRDPVDVVNNTSPRKTIIGADIGAQMDVKPNLRLGVMYRNLITPEARGVIFPRSLTIGAAWKPAKTLLVTGDLADIGDSTKLNLGTEWVFAREFALRAGLFDGAPTFGVGLTKYVNIAYSPTSTFVSLSIGF